MLSFNFSLERKMYIVCFIRRYFASQSKTEALPFNILKNTVQDSLSDVNHETQNKEACDKNFVKYDTNSNKNSNFNHLQSRNFMRKDNDEQSYMNDNFFRKNSANIQMLTHGLYSQLFKEKETHVLPSTEDIERVQSLLSKHNLLYTDTPYINDIDFELPELEGTNIEEHFYNIGNNQSGPYKILLNGLLEELRAMPVNWLFRPGWTRYTELKEPEPVPYPLEDAYVFDVEVCVEVGEMPVLATAASNSAWYGWVSPALIEGTEKSSTNRYFTNFLIPLESMSYQKYKSSDSRPRIVVGHNVSYDRARVKEQYWLQSTATRFFDTMSMHICVSGITSYQRAKLKVSSSDHMIDSVDDDWKKYSSLNSLDQVHKLYCGSTLKKDGRDVFIKGTLDDVRSKFQSLMSYCANDSLGTHNIFVKLFPLFLSRFPHPVTLAGMLELGTAYLPVNSNWIRYIDDANMTFADLESEAKFLLARRADIACELLHNNQYLENLWMWNEDWSVQDLKLINKNIYNKNSYSKTLEGVENEIDLEMNECYESDCLLNTFQYLEETSTMLPKKLPFLPGYPLWYRKLCEKPVDEEWVPGPNLLSIPMQITPKLLCLTWESYPLHYLKEHGWGILVPYTSEPNGPCKFPVKQLFHHLNSAQATKSTGYKFEDFLTKLPVDVQQSLSNNMFFDVSSKNDKLNSYPGTGKWCNVDIENCCWFLKLPHKDGEKFNVGNPLGKSFLSKVLENVLEGADSNAGSILSISRKLSYWRNNQERIGKQLLVWLDRQELPNHLRNENLQFGAIIPQIVVSGTLTRRAVEATWMTASNAYQDRVGSELRAMVQAPPGYHFVGADVDSQELWIASVIGDAYFGKMHGATPFGWMTLSGRKADGTDMHSVTAKAVGISRDQAKIINYARIYGAGQYFAQRLLKQFNPTMSDVEAKNKAEKMFALTKGQRVYKLKERYRSAFNKNRFTSYEAVKLARYHQKNVSEMFDQPEWVGGTESAMFNRLEQIALSDKPVTPFLKGHLSRAVGKSDHYLPTRVNWVVQSGAVDFLHLMLVSMRWLLPENARFCLSFHDEVRYLVPTERKYEAAISLHVTNLLARIFCASCLGLTDLPQSVAFFSSVEVDKVLRKEAQDDCCTPSNPYGLLRGYGIPLGESLTIHEALEKNGGSPWRKLKRNVSSNKKKACVQRSSAG